jgi:ubiquinone/menaquinone biosynthesis C-methylase UbiE
MERTPEPELMSDEDQAKAYAEADFEEAHSNALLKFGQYFPDEGLRGVILDLGCGPGDIVWRFAERYPLVSVVGVDGSRPMLEIARQEALKRGVANRVRFVEAMIPDTHEIPEQEYTAVVATSFLHHLHDPMGLWTTIMRHSAPGTLIYVVDLLRPKDPEEARDLVERYAETARPVLKRDFYHSLLAAFTIDEVMSQLEEAGLSYLEVEPISDRHFAVHGVRQ